MGRITERAFLQPTFNKCGHPLSERGFITRTDRPSGGLRSYCKQCSRERTANKRSLDVGAHNAYITAWRRLNGVQPRSASIYVHPIMNKRRVRLLASYGLTPEQFDVLLDSQNGVCAICGSDKWTGPGGLPHIDHDHVTGKVRGLLCSRCNIALGLLDDDARKLRLAASYLEAHLVKN